MAYTQAATGLTPQQWDDKFFVEYVRQSRFKRYMGTDENSIIQTKEDLTKKKGDSVTFALVNRLTGSGVTGSQDLEGAEEDLVSRSHRLAVDQIRHGVVVPVLEEQFSAIGLRDAGRAALKTWIMEKTRDDIIAALGSFNGVAYATATETQKDAWLVDNADRVLFGAAKSNNSSNDHSASLSAVDGSADKLTASAVSLMKRIALTASPKIRPVMTNEDEQWFVMFANSLAFRDLGTDSTIISNRRDALRRGENNPLFTGGDIIHDGVIVKEIEDIPVYANVGASGTTDVGPVYLCGAQSVGVAWSMRTNSVEETRDYKDKMGVAIREIRGIEKLRFGSGSGGDTSDLKDNGVLTGYFAAVSDS